MSFVTTPSSWAKTQLAGATKLAFWQLVGRRHKTFLARIGADGALLSKSVETKRRPFDVVARHFGGEASVLEALIDALIDALVS